MIQFVADSGIDIRSIDGVNFQVVPLTIRTDERTFVDDASLDLNEMLDYLIDYKGKSGSSCPSVDDWMKVFEGGNYGADRCSNEIYVVAMSSAMSGTYNSACIARDLYLEDHPDTKILVLDTLTIGPEQLLIMKKIVELKASGKSFEDVVSEINAYSGNHTELLFAFQSLHNLVANGRVSKVAGLAAQALNITIVGRASEEGTVEPLRKCRGKKKVIAGLMEELVEAGYHGGKVSICTVQNECLPVKVAEAIHEKWPEAEVECHAAGGLIGYYGERGGIIVGYEK